MHALRAGKPDLALEVSQALLQADRKNAAAWHLQAAAHAQAGRLAAGRRAAAQAFRFSRDSRGKFQMAQLASRLALQSGSPTLAQYWLRRTAVHAPDEKSVRLIARDYRLLRQINPWSFRLRSEAKPSTNVNNGSDDTLQIIDGAPSAQGRYGPRAVALSGTIGIADATLSRRLRENRTSVTSINARLYLQRVALSGEAKAKAAELARLTRTTMPRNSEFASTYAALTLAHAFAIGDPDKGSTARIALTAATSWYGGERGYDLIKLAGSRSWQAAASTRVELNASAEQRIKPRHPGLDATVLSAGAGLSRKLADGSSLNLTLGVRDTAAGHVNSTFRTATVRLGYSPAKSFGPVNLSTSLILGQSDYPIYYGGFPAQSLPGGRQDMSAYADLNLFFERFDYAGFAPMLRLRGGKRSSNHNRFDSTEFSVSLGIETTF
ncbi:hypothetical protein ACOHWE_04595 [Cribrihabitans neustonicus]